MQKMITKAIRVHWDYSRPKNLFCLICFLRGIRIRFTNFYCPIIPLGGLPCPIPSLCGLGTDPATALLDCNLTPNDQPMTTQCLPMTTPCPPECLPNPPTHKSQTSAGFSISLAPDPQIRGYIRGYRGNIYSTFHNNVGGEG